MSRISELVRKRLFEKMSAGDSLATGFYADVAPDDAVLPYLVFYRVPRSVSRTFQALSHESDLWGIKGLADKDSSVSMSPQGVAEKIASDAETAIGEVLDIPGHEVWKAQRLMDMPPMDEKSGDGVIFHRGFFLEVVTEA